MGGSVARARLARALILSLVALSLLLPACGETPPTPATPTRAPEVKAGAPPAATPTPTKPGIAAGSRSGDGPTPTAISTPARPDSAAGSRSGDEPTPTPTATPAAGQPTIQKIADVPSTWLKAWGAESELVGTAIVPANDGGYFVAGYMQSGSAEALVLKIDGAGQVIWRRQFEAADQRRLPVGSADAYLQDLTGGAAHYWIDLVATRDGGLALTLGPRLLRLDQNGDYLWGRSYTRGTRPANAYTIAALVELNDGGFALAGAYRTTNLATNYQADDTMLTRVSAAGEVRWAREYQGIQGAAGG